MEEMRRGNGEMEKNVVEKICEHGYQRSLR